MKQELNNFIISVQFGLLKGKLFLCLDLSHYISDVKAVHRTKKGQLILPDKPVQNQKTPKAEKRNVHCLGVLSF
ncbi:hypothetical protein [Bacillus sp. UNC437CL72CviS29]|uniref:hypothetical protein n=1 Tax=Bacillus sp. UNC437CL72CviS29 TaxID=1340430 RepID=UPI000479DFBA|nr:hypothetical protein [Bacillus sp. UNC437CL72CviS29]